MEAPVIAIVLIAIATVGVMYYSVNKLSQT